VLSQHGFRTEKASLRWLLSTPKVGERDFVWHTSKTYFVFGILCNIVKRCDVQLELATFTEFTEACAETDEIRAGN
jgi:hypothetical protein